MKDNFKYTKEMIEWRRNMVLSKLAKGYSQVEIAKELQLHPSTISLDVQYLKQKSRDELRKHITEVLPFEYSRVSAGVNGLLRKATDILEKTTDPKLQYQFMSLLVQVYGSILSMATDKGVIEQAMKKVEQLQLQSNTILGDRSSKVSEEETEAVGDCESIEQELEEEQEEQKKNE